MKKPKIVIIVQARMGSARLPGKPLKMVMGRPLLSYQIERLRLVKQANEIIVATTDLPQDMPIVDFCVNEPVSYFCGSEDDVLDRYYKAAKKAGADIVVRVTGDCPIIDPEIVDLVISFYLKSSPPYDYVSNTLKNSFPRGLDVEIFSFKNLTRAAKEAEKPYEREHVTPYFYLHPEWFVLGNVFNETDQSHHRWTVDEEADFQLITQLLRELYPIKPKFGMNDVLEVLKDHPEWMTINAHVQQKKLVK